MFNVSEAESISPEFLAILRCPACGAALEQRASTLQCLGAEGCGLAYPVEDGIPHLVVEEGRRPDAEPSS
jgi:uncharacterized protein